MSVEERFGRVSGIFHLNTRAEVHAVTDGLLESVKQFRLTLTSTDSAGVCQRERKRAASLEPRLYTLRK